MLRIVPHSSYCHTVVVCTKITVIISKNNAAYPYQTHSQNVFFRCIDLFHTRKFEMLIQFACPKLDLIEHCVLLCTKSI